MCLRDADNKKDVPRLRGREKRGRMNQIVLPGSRQLTPGERLQLAELHIRDLKKILVEQHQGIAAIANYVGAMEKILILKGVTTQEGIEEIAKKIREEGMTDTRVCGECGCTSSERCSVDGKPCAWVKGDLCSKCAEKILEPTTPAEDLQ